MFEHVWSFIIFRKPVSGFEIRALLIDNKVNRLFDISVCEIRDIGVRGTIWRLPVTRKTNGEREGENKKSGGPVITY